MRVRCKKRMQDALISRFKRDKSKALAWIKKISANKCLNHIKATRTVNVDDKFFEIVRMNTIP